MVYAIFLSICDYVGNYRLWCVEIHFPKEGRVFQVDLINFKIIALTIQGNNIQL